MIIVKNCTTSVFFPLWAVTNRSRHSKFSTRLFAIEESVPQNVKEHTSNDKFFIYSHHSPGPFWTPQPEISLSASRNKKLQATRNSWQNLEVGAVQAASVKPMP